VPITDWRNEKCYTAKLWLPNNSVPLAYLSSVVDLTPIVFDGVGVYSYRFKSFWIDTYYMSVVAQVAMSYQTEDWRC